MRDSTRRAAVLLFLSALLLGGCNFYKDYSDIGLPPDAGSATDDADAPAFVPECLQPSGQRIRYVSPDGTASGTGTRSSPLDLDSAMAQIQPGDEIVLLSGVYDSSIVPAASGTAQNPIVIRADMRHEAVFALSAANSVAFRLEDVSHVVVHGFKVTNSTSRWFLAWDSRDITISDSWFEGHSGVGVPASIERSQQITLADNVLGGTRKYTALQIRDAQQIRLLGNLFGAAPGTTIRVGESARIVMRANVFVNPVGIPLQTTDSDAILFEGNVVTSAIEGPGSPRAAATFTTSNLILRRNRFVRNWGAPLELDFSTTSHRADHIRVFHNVFAYNRDESQYDGEGLVVLGGGIFDDVLVFNNLFTNNGGAELGQLRSDDVAGKASIENNHFWADGGSPTIRHQSESRSVAQTEAAAPDVFRNNTVGSPSLTDRDENFRPSQSSPLVDAGRPLTRVTGGQSPGARVEVADPQVFFDGYGMPEERGDLIAIGSSGNVARIVSVDTSASTIELDRTLEFEVGDPVAAPWAGESSDVGGFERDLSSVAVVASTPRPSVGEAVTLTARLPEDLTPVRIEWRMGDGTSSCELSPSHAWRAPGNYGLRVTVIDSAGNVHRASEVVHVGQGEDDPTTLDFALETLRATLCDGSAQNYTNEETGLTEVGPKSDGEGYRCVAP